MSALHALVGLAAALTSADSDGRVVVDVAARTVKFVLLNAAALFGKVRSPAQTRGQMETKCAGAECCQRPSYWFAILQEAPRHARRALELRASASSPSRVHNMVALGVSCSTESHFAPSGW